MGQIENSPTTSEKNKNGYHAIFFQAKYSEKVKFYDLNKIGTMTKYTLDGPFLHLLSRDTKLL